jgi:hypothetical protein
MVPRDLRSRVWEEGAETAWSSGEAALEGWVRWHPIPPTPPPTAATPANAAIRAVGRRVERLGMEVKCGMGGGSWRFIGESGDGGGGPEAGLVAYVVEELGWGEVWQGAEFAAQDDDATDAAGGDGEATGAVG